MILLIVALRVVSLAPSITEMILFLGGERHLVGVTVHDTFHTVKHLPRIGGFADPRFEAIARLHPDLVLLTDTQRPLFEHSLRKLGISFRVIPGTNLQDLFAATETLAHILELPARDSLIADLREKVKNLPARADSPAVLIVVSRAAGSLEGLYVAGKATFYDDLFSRVGFVNAVDEQGYLPLNLEHALRLRPRWIVDITGDVQPEVYGIFRADTVVFLPSDPYGRPGLCALWHFVSSWPDELSRSIPCPPSAVTAR